MIKRFLFLVVFPCSLLAMDNPNTYVIGIVNDSSKVVQVQLKGSKGILIDRSFNPGDGMEKALPAKDESWLELRVYENGRLEFADRADLNEMRLPYFDVAKKESGFAFVIANADGKVNVTRALDFFGSAKPGNKPAGRPLPPTPGAKAASRPLPATPEAKPAAASSAQKYQVVVRNLEPIPLRIEFIAARDGKAAQGAILVNEQIEPNRERSYSFEGNSFPITLRVYQFSAGKEEMVLEDEVDLPKLKLSQFEFAVFNDLELNPVLRFNPNVPHGQGVKTKKSMQPKQVAPAVSASTAVQKPSTVVLKAPVFKNYEVRLENGSKLPLRFKLITAPGRTLFDGTIPGTPSTASKRTGTQLYSLVPSDFPLKVYSYDDSGMSGNFDWTFSLDQARANAAETRTSLAESRSVKSGHVQFGEENQFVIWVRDLRPTRTGTTHTVAGIDTYTK